MNNFFSGNIPELSNKQKQIRELQSFKSELKKLQPLQQEQRLEKGFARIKNRGVIDVLVLSMIVGVICGIGLVIRFYLIK